ncbi:28S ribosomal protein S31, mitochondrial [Acanthochromis polyacanthus]|uniref:28S ribosomal protein S31, mitochondrial n=1 Tax=Acanthochromis polyacanthus TaxID=80966 RepID=UPI0022340F7C|nr:28S ribosomal protein S31, mitochondrial [Acanthochromis polyacanthus]
MMWQRTQTSGTWKDIAKAIMYRFLSRTVCAARSSSVIVYESCALPTKCEKAAAPVFRVVKGGGVNTLSTSSVRICEKKNDDVPSNQDEKTTADKEDGPTETGSTKMANQTEEPVVLMAEDGSTVQQQADVKTEQVEEKQTQVNADVPKSGKESLLDLLGAMKVEVTNKRRLKNLKVKQNSESLPEYKSKPADMESTISMFQKATEEASSPSETLDPTLVAAASAAAATLPNSNQAESELLRQLRQRKAITEAQKKGDMNNLGEIITGMKVGKKQNQQNARPFNPIRFDDDGRGYTHDRRLTAKLVGVRKRTNLLLGKRLNIFSASTEDDAAESTAAQPTLWDMEFANNLSQVTDHTPRNGLEEMIQWTKEGKMWQYPVDNEAGLEEEASVPFHEHVFLEKHLEEGFPRQGPVRHFMELVVIGLSKNPYLTVQQKKEHISWFRDYFHQNEEILKKDDAYLS